MANIDLYYKGRIRKKRKPSDSLVGRPIQSEPTEPRKVLKISYLRNRKNLRWRKIGPLVGLSHHGAFLLYRKWKIWALTQRKYKITQEEKKLWNQESL